MDPRKILKADKTGIYCIPGKFYIDPMRPAENAVVTHGHADHARSGHNKVLATKDTIAIMKIRYGENSCGTFQEAAYGERLNLGDVRLSFFPAGHILGSAQIEIEYKGYKIIVSGDYKRRYDPSCQAFEVRSCNLFITEATFALPVFRLPEPGDEVEKLLKSIERFPNTAHLLGSYSLGKCQRMIMELRRKSFSDKIYLHGAMLKLCEYYRETGLDLGELEPVGRLGKAELKGKLILCPPSALSDKWSRRMGESITSMASGWMHIRARAKQRRAELPIIISDHADWNELTRTIKEINPEEVWVTHGREQALIRWCELEGYQAKALSLVGYEEENS